MYDPAVAAKMAVSYRSGQSTVAIGKRWGMNQATVRNWLLRQGVTLRPRGRRPGPQRPKKQTHMATTRDPFIMTPSGEEQKLAVAQMWAEIREGDEWTLAELPYDDEPLRYSATALVSQDMKRTPSNGVVFTKANLTIAGFRSTEGEFSVDPVSYKPRHKPVSRVPHSGTRPMEPEQAQRPDPDGRLLQPGRSDELRAEHYRHGASPCRDRGPEAGGVVTDAAPGDPDPQTEPMYDTQRAAEWDLRIREGDQSSAIASDYGVSGQTVRDHVKTFRNSRVPVKRARTTTSTPAASAPFSAAHRDMQRMDELQEAVTQILAVSGSRRETQIEAIANFRRVVVIQTREEMIELMTTFKEDYN